MMTNCSKGPDVTSLIKEKIRIPISQRQFDWLNNKYTLDQVSELLGFIFFRYLLDMYPPRI
jgi:hypothetical protein